MRNILEFAPSELGVRESAIVLLLLLQKRRLRCLWNFIGTGRWLVDWLWERIDSLVIVWIVFLCFCGNVPYLVSPSVFGYTP